jgi:arginase
MYKLFQKFLPIIVECNQGQPKLGVQFGGHFLYEHVFNNYKSDKVLSFPNSTFDNQNTSYFNLYKKCRETPFPIIIGGDHSIGASTVMASLYKNSDTTIIWIDAHADINTMLASKSKNKHGTPLAMCTGLEKVWWDEPLSNLLNFNNLIYTGIRDLDDFEKDIIKKNNIKIFSPSQVVDFIKNSNNKIHISFDVDALDPIYLDSTGTIASEGLSPIDIRNIIVEALNLDKLIGLDIVEFNHELGNLNKSINTINNIFEI